MRNQSKLGLIDFKPIKIDPDKLHGLIISILKFNHLLRYNLASKFNES